MVAELYKSGYNTEIAQLEPRQYFQHAEGRDVAAFGVHRTRMLSKALGRDEQNKGTGTRRIMAELLAASGFDPRSARKTVIEDTNDLFHTALILDDAQMFINLLQMQTKNPAKATNETFNLCVQVVTNKKLLEEKFGGEKAQTIIRLANNLLDYWGINRHELGKHNRLLAALPLAPGIEDYCRQSREILPKPQELVQTEREYLPEHNYDSSMEGSTNSPSLSYIGEHAIKKLGYSSSDAYCLDIQNKTVVDLGSGIGILNKYAHVQGAKPRKFINVNPASQLEDVRSSYARSTAAMLMQEKSLSDKHLDALREIDTNTKALWWDEVKAKDLDLENGSVDLVLSESGFPKYAQTPAEVTDTLKAVYDLLKTGGEFRISPLYTEEDEEGAKHAQDHSYQIMSRFQYFIKQAGFEIKEFKPIIIDGTRPKNDGRYLVLRKPLKN